MKKNIKTMLVLVLISITTLIFIPEVSAATLITSNNCYYFNSSTGSYSAKQINSNYDVRDCHKELTGETDVDGKKAYCVEWAKEIRDKSYQKNSSWNKNSKNAILAGIIIENINKNYSGNEAYGMTAAVLNTFFSKKYSYASSMNLYSTNDNIKKYYDGASKEYTDNGYNTSTSIPQPTISGTRMLDYNSTGKYYISKAIKATLTKEYGGDPVSYTITVNNQAQICTTSTGKGCSTSKTVTGTSYTFYVKVHEAVVSAGRTIKVTINGENSSTYPSVLQYIGTTYANDTQKLIVPTIVSVNRTTSQSYNLTVPDLTQHMIKIIKVDEYGNELPGSKLALYKDGTTGIPLKENINGNSEIIYTSPKATTETDDFFNHDYFLVERSSPNGYVLNNDVIAIEKEALNNSTTEICYNTEGEELQKVDSSRCDFENYDYVCLDSKGQKTDKVTVENNCEVTETPTPGEDGTQTAQEETETPSGGDNNQNEGNNNQGTEGDGETTEPTPEEPVETYTKACYSKSESKAVDSSYCTDKEKYTKIQTSKGNITIIKTNVLNKVYISKTDMTGQKEVPGASLKVCTKENYDRNNLNCETAKTIKGIEMSWISTSSSKLIQGVPTGKYVIIEVLPPKGYELITSVTEFEVDDTGKVISGGKTITEETPIVINNKINSLTISKQDITTSKELPGATLSICLTYYNEETKKIELDISEVTGDCIPVILADGTRATWISTNEPHKIEGLAVGTYYLVENIAPKGYSIAESILFTVNNDGSITDANNKPITDNKIIMKDEIIKQVTTGDLPLIAIITIGLVGLATGVFCYHYSTKKYNTI